VSLASARAAPSSLYLASRASALAVYSARSQVLRKEVSPALDLEGPDMVWRWCWGDVGIRTAIFGGVK